ncbi:hypothetical protein DTL21_04750 [Bremerella cremea]|uniref:DUF1963 domain-containing protein n=1 Tax=Blastopirellula marina TaxID=124 RepID=A0A2S8FYV0_9BACT|nr:hypothetical protein C5Y83_04750 [Blastopirellula marina]RCS49647.1 hypothetical protein DTL21_04750 [Bremerella cremea]
MAVQRIRLGLSEPNEAEVKCHIAASHYLALSSVVGPYDFLMLSEVRRRLPRVLLQAPTTPLAIFPLAFEPSDKNACVTYIGGGEVHQGISPWPKASDGELMPFVAQIDLRDAYGYRGCHVAIQVFGNRQCEFAYRWVNQLQVWETGPELNEARLFGDQPIEISTYPSGYGYFELDEDTQLECEENFPDRQLLNLPMYLTPLGLSIGPTPFLPAHSVCDGDWDGLTVLATIPTIYPQAARPCELFGRAEPLTDDEAQSLQMVIGPKQDDDSFGVLYVCRAETDEEIHLRYASL